MEIFYFGLKCVKPRCTSTYYIRNQYLRHSFDYLQRFCETCLYRTLDSKCSSCMKNPFVEILQVNLMIVSYSECYSVVRVCVFSLSSRGNIDFYPILSSQN